MTIRNEHGFKVLDLVITVTIMGLLAALSAPN